MGTKQGEKTLQVSNPELNIGEETFPLKNCELNVCYVDNGKSWSCHDKTGLTNESAMGTANYKEDNKPEESISGKSAVITGTILFNQVSLRISISHAFEEGFAFDVEKDSLAVIQI